MACPRVFATFALGVLLVGAAAAQIDDAKPRFDAASVKRDEGLATPIGNLLMPGGNVAVTNHSVRMLIGSAFGFDLNQARGQIVGLPAWADTERFSIRAAAPGNPSVAEKRLMLQGLLADRFKLTFHRETRQLPVFAMVSIDSKRLGPQVRPHTDDTSCDPASATDNKPVQTQSPAQTAEAALKEVPCGRVTGGLLLGKRDRAWAGGRGVTMQMIAAALGTMTPIERPVRDGTGLNGSYDFTMEWNPQIPDLPTAAPVDAPGLSFLQALREHVGLKLEPSRGPVDVLVIEHVERPDAD